MTSRAAADAVVMRRALELAENGWGQTAPNPMVGAVVVRDGVVAGEGFHARFGDAHAEVVALGAAGERARGATLYVTLEPCSHHGKTPPCVDAIIAAGVARVVIAALDPTADAGGGAERLRAAGITVESGVLEREARELNAPFFHAVASDTPWTTLKLAVSRDWGIAASRGASTWLTSAPARETAHRMRAGHDAIAVGVGTVLADDPRLTVRDWRAPRVPPTRVIFDRALRTPLTAAVVRTAREVPTIVVTEKVNSSAAKRLVDAGVRMLAARDIRDAVRLLRRENDVRSLLIEGGARIAAATIADEVAHRVAIFQAPVTLGPDALGAFDVATASVTRRLETLPVIERRIIGPDVLTVYALAES